MAFLEADEVGGALLRIHHATIILQNLDLVGLGAQDRENLLLKIQNRGRRRRHIPVNLREVGLLDHLADEEHGVGGVGCGGRLGRGGFVSALPLRHTRLPKAPLPEH